MSYTITTVEPDRNTGQDIKVRRRDTTEGARKLVRALAESGQVFQMKLEIEHEGVNCPMPLQELFAGE